MECPSCGENAPPEMKWCEACGSDLFAEPVKPCISCGESDISPEGYCMSCGHKQPAERDHMVFEDGAVVAVTDRGVRHRHNEDAAAIASLPTGGAVLVVCDGVSTTPGSAEASFAAANAARDVLVTALTGTQPQAQPETTSASELAADDNLEAEAEAARELDEERSDPAPDLDPADVDPADVDPADVDQAGVASDVAADAGAEAGAGADDPIAVALVAATAAAQSEAAAAPETGPDTPYVDGGPPSSTFVAAVARPSESGVELSVAWLGDSRAYWVDSEGAIQLTGDHEIGGSLTRWLGADSMDTHPDITRHHVEREGRLLLCSDGLWRYAETPAELATLVRVLESDNRTNNALAEALVKHAIDGGGHDNITVALWASVPDAKQVSVEQPNGTAGGETESSQGVRATDE